MVYEILLRDLQQSRSVTLRGTNINILDNKVFYRTHDYSETQNILFYPKLNGIHAA